MRRKVTQIFRADIILGGDLVGQKPVLIRKTKLNAENDTSAEWWGDLRRKTQMNKKKAKEKDLPQEIIYNYQYVS